MRWQSDGRQIALASTGFEQVQSRALSTASVADGPIFAKVKSWRLRSGWSRSGHGDVSARTIAHPANTVGRRRSR
jgi:hypothetical protein